MKKFFDVHWYGFFCAAAVCIRAQSDRSYGTRIWAQRDAVILSTLSTRTGVCMIKFFLTYTLSADTTWGGTSFRASVTLASENKIIN